MKSKRKYRYRYRSKNRSKNRYKKRSKNNKTISKKKRYKKNLKGGSLKDIEKQGLIRLLNIYKNDHLPRGPSDIRLCILDILRDLEPRTPPRSPRGPRDSGFEQRKTAVARGTPPRSPREPRRTDSRALLDRSQKMAMSPRWSGARRTPPRLTHQHGLPQSEGREQASGAVGEHYTSPSNNPYGQLEY